MLMYLSNGFDPDTRSSLLSDTSMLVLIRLRAKMDLSISQIWRHVVPNFGYMGLN